MLSKVFHDKEVHKLQTYINKGEKFVIVTHFSPDGDAIGSSLGLFHYLSVLGKDSVNVVVPNDFPNFLKWMPGAENIVIYEHHEAYAQRLMREAEVIFCVDFNELKRIGPMASMIESADARIVMIDHHLNPAGFARLTLSYPDMSSTSEMVFRLICALKSFDDINTDAAACIYTGMMTDTGAFTFNSNNPDLYLIVMELLKKGINKDLIYKQVYQVYSAYRMRLQGYLLHEKMTLYHEQKAALLTVSLDELNRFHYVPGDTEGFVNLPLSIEGVEFAVFIREDKEQVKISLRSVGNFPCNRFAAEYFNGGGHKNASGGELSGTLSEAIAVFEQGLEAFNPLNYKSKK